MGMEESEYKTCEKCGKSFHEDDDHICGKNPKELYFYHNGVGFKVSFFETDDEMIFLEDNTFIARDAFMEAIKKAY